MAAIGDDQRNRHAAGETDSGSGKVSMALTEKGAALQPDCGRSDTRMK